MGAPGAGPSEHGEEVGDLGRGDSVSGKQHFLDTLVRESARVQSSCVGMLLWANRAPSLCVEAPAPSTEWTYLQTGFNEGVVLSEAVWVALVHPGHQTHLQREGH